MLESGVRIEVEVPLGQTFSPETLPRDVPVSRSDETVAWGATDDGKTWRILYRNYLQEGTYISGQVSNPAWLENNPIEHRPLIETPVAIRLKAAAAGVLGELVKQITAQIPRYDADIPVEGELRLVDFYNDLDGGYHDGFGLMFVPASGTVEDRLHKIYSEHQPDQLLNDLQSLDSAEVNEKLRDWQYRGFNLPCTLSFRALRRLGLIG